MWKTTEGPEPYIWSMLELENGEHAYGWADWYGFWWTAPNKPIREKIKRFKIDDRQMVQVPVNWTPHNIFNYRDTPIVENDNTRVLLTVGVGGWNIQDCKTRKMLMSDADVFTACRFLNQYSFGVRHVK